jgi:hypothetical protein
VTTQTAGVNPAYPLTPVSVRRGELSARLHSPSGRRGEWGLAVDRLRIERSAVIYSAGVSLACGGTVRFMCLRRFSILICSVVTRGAHGYTSASAPVGPSGTE